MKWIELLLALKPLIGWLTPRNSRYKRFFMSSPLLAVIIDTECVFISVNEAFAKKIGYEPSELIGKRFTKFIAPATRESTMDKMDGLRDGYAEGRFTNRYIRKDGATVEIHWIASWVNGKGLAYAIAES